MKLKVNELKIKSLLVEDSYQESFSKIRKNDVFIIKTGRKVYTTKVVDTFGNQIIIKWNDQYYLLTSNSLNGDVLKTRRFVSGGDGKKTVEGPEVKGIYNIIIKRNGDTVSGVSLDKGRNKSIKKNINKRSKQNKVRYEELKSVLKSLDKGNVVNITVGKLITKGSDKGSLAKNTEAILSFVVNDSNAKNIKLTLKKISGNASSKYSYLKSKPIFIKIDSLEPSGQSIRLNYKYKNDSGNFEKDYIDNVFGIDNVGMEEPDAPEGSDSELSNSEKLDIIKASPALRRRYMGEPSLFNKLFRRDRILPRGDILNILDTEDSVLSDIKKGDKIHFIYSGDTVEIANDLYIQNKEKYVGKYLGDSRIIIKSKNRKDSIEFKILGEIDDNGVAVVDVKHKYIKDNIPNINKLKRSKIKIIDDK